MPDVRKADETSTRDLEASRQGGALPAADDPAAPSLWLRLDDGRRVPMGRRLTVGSAAGNDLVLADPYVSARHCVIERVGRHHRLTDLQSRNGSFVAGARVMQAELRPGVRLVVGQTGMRFGAYGSVAGDAMIGRSPALERLRAEIARVGPTRAPVLLLGESGTGKELAARAIHVESGRRGEFVAINCGAIAAELVESELFGHERGAFTGAVTRRAGVFQEADGGTLFLDELGELPLTLQPKLLRALETGMIRAVGGASERRVDVRVVAATLQDLPRRVAEGSFRLDLYHRLSAVELYLAPLRERKEDIALLAAQFLEDMVAEVGVKTLSPAALRALCEYPWPGNVRELHNALRRGAIFGGALLEAADVLPERKLAALKPLGDAFAAREPGAPYLSEPPSGGRLASSDPPLAQIERQLIERALVSSHGSRRAAAKILGMAKSTLCDKVRRYGIRVDER